MDEKKNTPIKNIVQTKNDISKNKIFLLQPYKPINIRQVSSQFRECNKMYFANEKDDSKKLKQKNININYIKNNNFFRLHSASKNRISLSQEKENKNKKMHEDNLKKMKELQKILDDLQNNNNSLSNEIDKLNNEKNNLESDLQKKDDEEKEITTELNNLKNINEEKNREYLHLQQREIQNNNNNSIDTNRRQRRQNLNNNNSGNNNEEFQPNEIDLLNRLLRLQRQIVRNEEGNGGENSLGASLNDTFEQIELLNEDLGPPMTMEQIEALPNEKYPKKNIYNEKCILCGFNIYYNDSITKLQQCQHFFHKECFANFLTHKQASKCPICKVSLI